MVAKAKAAKAAKKASARPVPAAKPAKAAAKRAPAPRKAPTKPAAAKAAAKTAAKPTAKPTARPVAKPAPKQTPPLPRPTARPALKAVPAPAAIGAAATVAIAPRPAPAPRVAPAASPKEVAAAHEYLLTRSANRSEEPIVVNGRRLPTEEQLLKMPDSAYMNEDQLAFFKHRLQQMEQELLANAGETTEHLRETVIVPDPADRATIEEEHALELRTRDRERKLLKKVQAALQRIESGDYGYCEETGDPIGIPRLIARPTATLSLEAQQRRELKQKLFGD
jgi:DnaK suppressor protein